MGLGDYPASTVGWSEALEVCTEDIPSKERGFVKWDDRKGREKLLGLVLMT